MIEKNETQKKKDLPVLRGELALLVVVLINSLGVVLMLYSGSGISAISSVPYAFSEVFTKVSLGTWTYIFQGLLVLSLMIMRKKFVAPYLFSFVVGFANVFSIIEPAINGRITDTVFMIAGPVIFSIIAFILYYLYEKK